MVTIYDFGTRTNASSILPTTADAGAGTAGRIIGAAADAGIDIAGDVGEAAANGGGDAAGAADKLPRYRPNCRCLHQKNTLAG